MVVCTQIHQQSTVELALRVADEMDVNIGNEVGYSIPLQTCCSPDTVLRCVYDPESTQRYLFIFPGLFFHSVPLSAPPPVITTTRASPFQGRLPF